MKKFLFACVVIISAQNAFSQQGQALSAVASQAKALIQTAKTHLAEVRANAKKQTNKIPGAGVVYEFSDGKAIVKEAANGDIGIVKALIKMGVNVNVRDEHGSTALIEASLRGYIDIVKLLIKAGADVNLGGDDGGTALMYANNIDIFKYLIVAGADINEADGSGNTALMEVVRANDVRRFNLLMKSGADINMTNISGHTALGYAVPNSKIFQTLVKAGAKRGPNDD